jgi:hypothetical protein
MLSVPNVFSHWRPWNIQHGSAWLDMLALLAGSAVLGGLVLRFETLGPWGGRDIDIRYGVESHFERKNCSKAQKRRLCTLLAANTQLASRENGEFLRLLISSPS